MDPVDCTSPHHVDPADRDRCFMAAALASARGAGSRTWPNPPVGAVVVKDGVIVGRGAHRGPGRPHAEPLALAEAGDRARGATLYVTLEPCNHQGRTAPCAPDVVASGVSRVVVAMRDPNPSVTGGGCRYLRDRGVDVQCGVLAAEALEMVWPFASTDNFSHTYVELKTALSLDGFFAPPAEARAGAAPVYLTGPDSLLDVHRRRRGVDLVLVGEGTVRADAPRLDGRRAADCPDVPRDDPLAGYVDTDLSWTGGFQRDEYLVFAGESARKSANRAQIEADGGEILFCRETAGRVEPASLCAAAAGRGLPTLMVEGGPRLAASFLRAGLVDRWVRYLAPVLLGGGVAWPSGGGSGGGSGGRPGSTKTPFTLTSQARLGDDLRVIHDRRDFAGMLARVTI